MNYSGLCYRVYTKAFRTERALIPLVLTSVYTYFPKLFCQNNVKKNRKSVVGVFFKNTDIRHKEEWLRANKNAQQHGLCLWNRLCQLWIKPILGHKTDLVIYGNSRFRTSYSQLRKAEAEKEPDSHYPNNIRRPQQCCRKSILTVNDDNKTACNLAWLTSEISTRQQWLKKYTTMKNNK